MQKRQASSLVLMGARIIMGSLLVETLNGDVPEDPLPKTLEEARVLMVPSDDGFETYLPKDFPKVKLDTAKYGLTNTHPAPSIVTANTFGMWAQRRMVALEAAESAQTYHAVAHGVDTGPIIAAHKFFTRAVRRDASPHEIEDAALLLNRRLQIIEKTHLPLDVEMQLIRRQRYLLAS